MNARYITAKDTAKLVRKALKRAFPDTTFSVRSDHNSINVRWTDGPTTAQVDPIAKQYQGGGFDGMIDLAYTSQSWLLPDGSATWAHSAGTEGSMGVVESYDYPPPPGAELVNFGAKYVFTSRDYSAAFLGRMISEACDYYQIDERPTITTGRYGGVYLDGEVWIDRLNDYNLRIVHKWAAKVAA